MRYGFVLLLVFGCTCNHKTTDYLHFHDRPAGSEAGVVLDASDVDGGPFNDRIVLSTADEKKVGKLTAGPNSNDLICFCRGRPPVFLREPVGDVGSRKAWTAKRDDAHVRFLIPEPLSMTVWVLQSGTAAMDHAKAAVDKTNDLFDKERMGIEFAPTYVDASSFTNADKFLEWDKNAHHDAVRDQTDGIKDPVSGDLAYTEKQINVYMVAEVDGKPKAGHTDVSNRDTIALGEASRSHLLAHELGHAFYLDHPNDFEAPLKDEFDRCNLMWEFSTNRNAITEGQIFKAHFVGKSALIEQYELRDGSAENPILDWIVLLEGPTESIVPISLRVWPDPKCPAQIDLVPLRVRPEPGGQLPLPDPQLARAWAEIDCVTGRSDELILAEVLRRGARMEPHFLELFDGPDKQVVAEVGAVAGNTFDLLSHAPAGVTRSDWIKREARSFLDGHQAVVIDALGEVGTVASLPRLTQLTSFDSVHANRSRAERAIKKIQSRQPR